MLNPKLCQCSSSVYFDGSYSVQAHRVFRNQLTCHWHSATFSGEQSSCLEAHSDTTQQFWENEEYNIQMRLQERFGWEDVNYPNWNHQDNKADFSPLRGVGSSMTTNSLWFFISRNKRRFAHLAYPMQWSLEKKQTATLKLKIKESIHLPINLLGRLKKISLRDTGT